MEKLARALEIPLYQLFYEGSAPPELPNLLKRKTSDDWGSSGRHAMYVHKLRQCLSKVKDSDRKLLLSMAKKVVARRNRRAPLHRTEAVGARRDVATPNLGARRQ
jgi:hypothetical protein